MSVYRTALIGAGFISSSHIEALKAGAPGAKLAAIVDRNLALAEAQARRWKIPKVFPDVESLIAAGVADVAHVLVPPDAHAQIARQLLESGLNVFLEKPMTTSSAEGDALIALAARKSLHLGVNQNFVFHPAYQRAKKILLEERRLGPIRSLHILFNVPLRQLSAFQFGHWMFRQPLNILLEQAVHPLSQLVDLLGAPAQVSGGPETYLELAPNKRFYDCWGADFAFPESVAQLHLAFGQKYHAWRIAALCDDGVLVCDMSADRVLVQGRSQYPDFLDAFVTGGKMGASLIAQSAATAGGYIASLLKLRPRSEGFAVSMRESVRAFYQGLDAGRVPVDGAFGNVLVRICETLSRSVESDARPELRAVSGGPSQASKVDVVVFGGTGFIGTRVVRRLVEEGRSVRVVARSADRSQPPFDSPRVEVMRGDVTNRSDVERAVAGARQVVNLAHGGGGASWEDIERTMVESGRAVAECSAASGAERLVHVGSIAGLYLGDAADTISGATPPDPQAASRSLYARGKAEADRALQAMAEARGLGLVILRPGLVVGSGTPALHGGLGFFNNEQHVIGWNAGRNALPFVLVDDVADAICRALDRPAALGKAYNLVGDVRPTAREFMHWLASSTSRPLAFHPQSVTWLYAAELFKWGIKRATGKASDFPSKRDLLSRGLKANFDCSDAKRDLGWTPVADRDTFIARAIEVHRAPFTRVSMRVAERAKSEAAPLEGRAGA